jgi:hypothetical protein
MISHENRIIPDRTMGVETPMSPITIDAAAPDRKPPRRIRTVEIIISRFSWLGGKPDGSWLFHQNIFFKESLSSSARSAPGR